MMKCLILTLLLVLAVGLAAPLALAQTTGSVKGVCKDIDGTPLASADVEWSSTETGHKYDIKTNKKGEYFSLGISPGKYNIILRKDGKELFHINGITVGLEETAQDIDLKKEQSSAAQGQGLTPEQAKARAEAVHPLLSGAAPPTLRATKPSQPVLMNSSRPSKACATAKVGRRKTSPALRSA